MGRMRIMGRRGDSVVEWDQKTADAAQKKFDEFLTGGGLAFKADKVGGEAEQVKSFDPKAEELILVPQIRGGM